MDIFHPRMRILTRLIAIIVHIAALPKHILTLDLLALMIIFIFLEIYDQRTVIIIDV